MMEWFNNYAPGFVRVRHKLNPFGKWEAHYLFWLKYILWRSQILKGKECSKTLGQKEHNE